MTEVFYDLVSPDTKRVALVLRVLRVFEPPYTTLHTTLHSQYITVHSSLHYTLHTVSVYCIIVPAQVGKNVHCNHGPLRVPLIILRTIITTLH